MNIDASDKRELERLIEDRIILGAAAAEAEANPGAYDGKAIAALRSRAFTAKAELSYFINNRMTP